MANIVAKKKPVIKKGDGFVYDPKTFEKEHAVDIFVEVSFAQQILDNIKPLEYRERKFVFFDTETHPHYKRSQDVPKGVVRRWVGTGKKAVPQDYPFSFQICDGNSSYILYSDISTMHEQLKLLAPLFLDPTIEWVAHNTKYDMHMIHNCGLKIAGKLHDTVVLTKLVDENRMSFELKKLAARVERGITKFESMVDTYKQLNKITDYRDIPRPLLTQYGGADVWNCFRVFVENYDRLVLEDGLEDLYNKEMEVMIALYAMERRGMRVDMSYEDEIKTSLQKTVDEAEAAVYEIAGKMFNMNSGKQLYEVMLSLGVDSSVVRFSDKGNPKLDKDEMKRLDEIYHIPIISKVQEYKKADKLLNTYAMGIYDQVDSEGKVHGSINQTEATTGRMSITKPALQTLPKKDKRIRRMFIPKDKYELWFMDLDQIEYRLFAHYAKATGLLEAINKGYDVHAATAALLTHTSMDSFMTAYEAEEQWAIDARANAKTINFAMIYGVGNEHLTELLRCTATEAARTKSDYFIALPEARPFINTVHSVIRQRGFVKNFYGRRRRLSSNDAYKAPNSLIQGCAADYIKSRLVDMYKYMVYNELDSGMTNIVHDELILELLEHEAEYHAPRLRWLLSDFNSFRCVITAGSEKGNPSWGEKEKADVPFIEPEDKGYLNYNLFDGHVFDL